MTDSLTAPRADLKSLPACFKEFRKHRSPQIIAGGIALALAARVVVGDWSWRDPVIFASLILAQPFVEWVIHKYLLHRKPVQIRGREYDLPTSYEHRKHHLDPSKLNEVLLKTYSVGAFLPMIALTSTLTSFVFVTILGGSYLAVLSASILFSYILLGYYEWIHFLIHTPYVPKNWYYRTAWRSHRLHHYKHEHYWLGVTSNLSDRALKTFPDKDEVPKSPTARTLGVDM